ncbi:MAG: TonB-dependent receptor [Halioglobus sp.]
MSNRFNKNTLALAVALATGSSQFAHAQLVLEEVVVTAQKRPQTLEEAPLTVNVVSGEQIRDFDIFQADELSKLTAGVQIRNEGDSNSGVAMRGVGTLTQQAAPSRVGVYMDDWYVAGRTAFVFKQMFDISQVQMLRGPQGTLYGQPSPTGALIINSADPNLQEMEGYVTASFQDPTGYNIQGAISIPIIENELAIRFAALSDERETGLKNITRGLENEVNSEGYRAKLLWEPNDVFSMKFSWTHVESEDSDTYRPLESITADATFQLDADDRTSIQDSPDLSYEEEDDLFTLHLNWDLGPVELKLFAASETYDSDSDSDNDFTEQPGRNVGVTTEGKTDDQIELRAIASPTDWWDIQLGYFYQRRDLQTDVPVNTNVPPSLVAVTNLDIPTGSDIDAVFAHNEFHFSDSTSLIVGLRYNVFDSKASNTSQTDLLFGSTMEPGGNITEPDAVVTRDCPDGSAAPCLLAGGEEEKEWTGTLKLVHAFSDDLHGYATYDRGFRPGAPNFDTQALIPPEMFTYDGESVNSIELGLKGELWGGQAQWSAATFYNLYEDYQVEPAFSIYDPLRGTGVPIASVYANADEVEQYGIEGEFRMLLTEYWSMFTSLSYNKVEFKKAELPCNDPSQPPLSPENPMTTCDLSGEPAGEQPEWTWVLQSEYRRPLDVIGGDWWVNGLFNYNGEAEKPGDTAGRLTADSYTQLDLYAGLGTERWTAKLWVKNVFDDADVITKRVANDNYNDLSIVPPRTTGVTLSYRF